MAEIISFRKAQKAAAHKADKQQANENRIRFGRTKVQKENDRRTEERRKALLDGAKRVDSEAE